ncbi:anaerobic ribonucleoside-triphosphate reductase activating protein [Corynebacterium sp. S7]
MLNDERSRTFAQTDTFRIADYKPFQVLDGEGLRCSLYVSYCPFNCAGCYNKAAQKKGYGEEYTPELEERILTDLSNPHVAGLTLCGGEPMLSAKWLLPLVTRVRREFPEKTIWSYTGYRFEILRQFRDERAELLGLLDVLIDGQFNRELRDEGHLPPFRGSSNQRLIDVKSSLSCDDVVELQQTETIETFC